MEHSEDYRAPRRKKKRKGRRKKHSRTRVIVASVVSACSVIVFIALLVILVLGVGLQREKEAAEAAKAASEMDPLMISERTRAEWKPGLACLIPAAIVLFGAPLVALNLLVWRWSAFGDWFSQRRQNALSEAREKRDRQTADAMRRTGRCAFCTEGTGVNMYTSQRVSAVGRARRVRGGMHQQSVKTESWPCCRRCYRWHLSMAVIRRILLTISVAYALILLLNAEVSADSTTHLLLCLGGPYFAAVAATRLILLSIGIKSDRGTFADPFGKMAGFD